MKKSTESSSGVRVQENISSPPLNPPDLGRIFRAIDKNGDGLVSIAELNWLLKTIGVHYSKQELESLVGKPTLDLDGFFLFWDSISKRDDDDGNIHHDDGHDDDDDDLVKAFKVFDLDGDGFITSDELQKVLSRLELWDEKCGKDCKSMICRFDQNLDGVLDLHEFKEMMLNSE